MTAATLGFTRGRSAHHLFVATCLILIGNIAVAFLIRNVAVMTGWGMTFPFHPLFTVERPHFLLVALVGPFIEEAVFRGILFSATSALLGLTSAVLLTSVAWAAIHTSFPVYALLMVFCQGLILGCGRIYSGSIFPGFIAHVLFNATIMAGSGSL